MLELVPDILPFSQNQQLDVDINEAAYFAYMSMSTENGYNPAKVYRLGGACFDTADFMQEAMTMMGYNVWTETRNSRDTSHRYVVLGLGAGKEIVIDPTWFQFAGGSPNDAPKVLVGTREQVTSIARANGVGKAALNLWAA